MTEEECEEHFAAEVELAPGVVEFWCLVCNRRLVLEDDEWIACPGTADVV